MDTLGGATAAGQEPDADDGRLFCYRHPDRETWVRCGRCDRPICPKCAMQGPVGFRCHDCGKPAFDPLTSFTPKQVVLGALVALVGGTIAAFLASRIGFFAIFISFFAGGFIAEAVVRVTGYKRGPVMLGVVFGGIVVGTLVAFGLDYALMMADMQAMIDATAAAAREAGGDVDAYVAEFMASYGLVSYVADAGVWALLSAGAACFGAWSRLR
jgi:hypothetical protein